MPANNELFTAIERYDKMKYDYLVVRLILFLMSFSCSHSHSTQK